MPTKSRTAPRPPRLYPTILFIVALVLLVGGVQLASVGGSLYYLLAGLATGASGVLIWKGKREGAWLFASFLVATVAWAVWEAGFNGWALVPRLAAPLVLGLWLLLPHFSRRLQSASDRSSRFARWANPAGFLAAAVVAVMVGALLHQLRPEQTDPMFTVASSPSMAGDRTAAAGNAAAGADWTEYGGDAGGRRYSSLAQITPANVSGLEPVWTYHVGAAPKNAKASLEVTPLKIGDTVYICSGFNDVIALDAETGKQRWRYNANSKTKGVYSATCRGVAYYKAPSPVADCPERIITNTIDARLIALDARTGAPCQSFGRNGAVSLLAGMGKVLDGYYYVTSAPAIVRGKVVLGGWVSDGQYWGEPSGVIRGFDAVTGNFAWAFDMGRPDEHGQPGPGEQYTHSTPNAWAPMSVDETLGLVYVPTGNATPDQYGAQRRPFDDKYSSSVVALDGASGAVRWSFQTTHHDLWDYDVSSQPTLVDLPAPDGGVQHALLQATKRGEVFMLDRVTGRPIAAVAEKPVPTSGAAPGERVSPTQPFSVGMPSFRGPDLTESMMWGVTPIDQMMCRIWFKQLRYDGTMTPPGLTRSLVYPGPLGGMDWGGVSVDPVRQIMVVNTARVANTAQLISRAEADRLGMQPAGVGKAAGATVHGGGVPQGGTPFGALPKLFFSKLGAPCMQPPYGLMSAVDLKTRRVLWSRPIGSARDSGPLGLPSYLPVTLGTPNIGGSVVTAGGLIFIGATQEKAIRAIDITTGKTVWKARLPAGGQATPSTWISPKTGRQFVVIAAGGNIPLQSGMGDAIIAYALPKR
ncbi:membrane-bound PQQ-dependent dehydrogenase, glucose/quinate/shikimate family [Sphingomonas sp. PL-96]|uniref:membrane-bound PQQ-dependent dehydrogenase, glucose/quinate/shikimate family n=1 Tax=Sphingomonas sp. PL-96 TaxID=2887201 RepID=UPI001E43A9DA|nr:membrane-bound PQQ-dependent dehydrogenase, glucose/quinate/shikimate family [Sphingomonas sp. PL-96]MCC2978034.1 membrane-bound PQQ-dependent dehydrogenase, glucose/quinate/shikimate family [Sphingomonas sp. PL-96]